MTHRHLQNDRSQFVLQHASAGLGSLLFAWVIFQTPYYVTGLQFVGPLIVCVLIHSAWNARHHSHWSAFFSIEAFYSAAGTVLLLLFVVTGLSLTLPTPAEASDIATWLGGAVGAVLMTVFCLLIIIAVMALFIFPFVLLGWLYNRFVSTAKGEDPKQYGLDHSFNVKQATTWSGKAFRVLMWLAGIFYLACFAMAGVIGIGNQVHSRLSMVTVPTQVSPQKIWDAIELAESPKLNLPPVLKIFPAPTAIVQDAEFKVGQTRTIQFAGREGVGELVLEVTAKQKDRLVLTVLSDSSPLDRWIEFQSLVFLADDRSFNVALSYDRKLSPGLFFDPFMSFVSETALKVMADHLISQANSHQTKIAMSTIEQGLDQSVEALSKNHVNLSN